MRLHFVAWGLDVPDRMPALPPARDFLLSAGFGGAAALVAAVVVAVIAVFVARGVTKRHRAGLEQQERHHREIREAEQRTAAITRCWQRLVWVVETAGLEPASESATLGLGPELALEILRGLLRDAEQLGDDTLASAVMVHLNQFSLVLAHQAGSLTELTTVSGRGKDSASATSPTPGSSAAPDDGAAAVHQSGPAAVRGASGRTGTSSADGDEPGPTAATKAATTRARRRTR